MPMQHVTRADAVTRSDFEVALEEWLASSHDNAIGEGAQTGNTPWVYVRHDGGEYYFNADSKRDGVETYLRMLRVAPSLAWSVVPNAKSGRENKVAFGSAKRTIPGS